MNHPDPNFWKNLAAQWIQSKTQTQPNFLQNFPQPQNYGFQQQIHHHQPQFPINSMINADNLEAADMDIEDVKEDPEPGWPDPTNPINQLASHRELPRPQKEQSLFPSDIHRNEVYNDFELPQIPSAPIIGQISESIDMDLSDEDDETNAAILEIQKQKKLPLWLREALEKREREKKLEQDKLKMEKELELEAERQRKLREEALLELEKEKKSVKSRYDSDPESEESEPEPISSQPPPQEDEEEEDQEDSYEQMMLLVRKTLTEILLEVTNEIIQEISKETVAKYRKKASSVTSNRSGLVGRLGLGAYAGSSDEDSEGEGSEKNEDGGSDFEPEHVLKERIRQKSLDYERRTKEIREKLARIEELEQERYGMKKPSAESQEHSRNDSEDEKPKKSKTGEEKYEKSVSSSYARQRDKKKTRFNDPKERSTSGMILTHVGIVGEASKATSEISPVVQNILPTPQMLQVEASSNDRGKKDRRNSNSSSLSTSSGSSRHKKSKKHKKKSSKHSKKSSKKRERSRSRDRDREKRKSTKSDRNSIESKSSVRSSESRRYRSRSRSRSRDRSYRSRRY